MQTIILKPLYHREKECIGLYFENSSMLNGTIRKNAGARWSQTNKCWYVPLSKENYDKIFFALKGMAEIEQSALHTYLTDKKKKGPYKEPDTTTRTQAVTTKQPPIAEKKQVMTRPAWINKQVTIYKAQRIQLVNAHVLPAMEQRLKLKAYSPSTIKTYLGEMAQLLTLLKEIPVDQLTTAHLKRYLVFCFEKLQLKENTLHSRINAFTPLD